MKSIKEATVRFKVYPITSPLIKETKLYQARVLSDRPRGIHEIAGDLVATGCAVNATTIEYVLQTFADRLPEMMAATGARYELGGLVTLRPVIGGSFDSVNAPFDPDRNDLHIAASVPRTLRKSLAGARLYNVTAAGAKPRIKSIYADGPSRSVRNAILYGGRRTVVAGLGLLLVPGRPDEGAWLTGGSLAAPFALDVFENNSPALGMRLPEGTGPESLPPGQYTLLIATRAGRDADQPLFKLRRAVGVREA